MTPRGTIVARAALVLGWVLFLIPAAAHEFSITDVEAHLLADGSYRVDVTVDVDALALGVSPSTDSAQVVAHLNALNETELQEATERARRTLGRWVRIRFDGVKQVPQVEFPGPGTSGGPLEDLPTVLGVSARFTGAVPQGAQAFTFGASRSMKGVMLTIADETSGQQVRHLLEPSEDSPPFLLGQIVIPETRVSVVRRYIVLGFEHILPLGLDHILFVLGLFLLSPRVRPLLLQITAFTVAHTITLGMSIYGIVSLPSRPVETLIALSIAYVGFENLFTERLRPWRTGLVFLFGLLHGLGFAGVLRELGLPPGEFVTALLGFNFGVELGQLCVIGIALLLVGRFRDKPWRRRRIVVPASLAIALVGVYWTVERAFSG